MSNKKNSIKAIGNSLIEHVRDAASERQGIIEDMFPHIVHASKKISARAICRFLEEKHDIKISYVTVGRALRNPAKYWNLYFDAIERHAWNVAEAHGKTLRDFISEPKKYHEMLEAKPAFQFDVKPDPEDMFAAADAYKYSVKVLDEKWFCFDEDILEEARFYLLKRFVRKPTPQTDNGEEDQDQD